MIPACTAGPATGERGGGARRARGDARRGDRARAARAGLGRRGRRGAAARRHRRAERRRRARRGRRPRADARLPRGAAAPGRRLPRGGALRVARRGHGGRGARPAAAAARDGVRRRRRDDGGVEPRRDGRAPHAGRLRHRGGPAREPAPARLRLFAPGEQRVAPAPGLEPHEPARVRGERPVVRAVRGADGAAVARRARGRVGRPEPRVPGGPRAAGAPRRGACSAERRAAGAAFRAGGRRRDARRLRPELAGRPRAGVGGGGRRGRARRRRAPAGRGARAGGRTAVPRLRSRPGVDRARRERPRLQSFVDALVPHGSGLLALLGVAVVSAIVANLVNNLPATLILLPVAAAGGPGPVLAMLIGVNVGPNLTYVGSLATLLWRRVVHAHDEETDLGEFLRLGALTVPPALVAGTVLLWLALRVV